MPWQVLHHEFSPQTPKEFLFSSGARLLTSPLNVLPLMLWPGPYTGFQIKIWHCATWFLKNVSLIHTLLLRGKLPLCHGNLTFGRAIQKVYIWCIILKLDFRILNVSNIFNAVSLQCTKYKTKQTNKKRPQPNQTKKPTRIIPDSTYQSWCCVWAVQ